MKRALIVAAAAMLLPSAAVALSCMAPDVVRDYHYAAEADENYMIVHGTLSFDRRLLPETDLNIPQPPAPAHDIAARLQGVAMTQNGFKAPYDEYVTLRVECYAVWCAAPEPGEVLAFVRLDETGPVVMSNPCGSLTHPDPTIEQAQQVYDCFRGVNCAPAPER